MQSLSISSTLSFPYGHPVSVYIFFLILPSRLSLFTITEGTMEGRNTCIGLYNSKFLSLGFSGISVSWPITRTFLVTISSKTVNWLLSRPWRITNYNLKCACAPPPVTLEVGAAYLAHKQPQISLQLDRILISYQFEWARSSSTTSASWQGTLQLAVQTDEWLLYIT